MVEPTWQQSSYLGARLRRNEQPKDQPEESREKMKKWKNPLSKSGSGKNSQLVPYLETHGEEVVPVVEEESLLRDAEQAGHQREDGQAMLGPGAHVQGLWVQLLDEVFQAGNVYFVFDRLWAMKIKWDIIFSLS